MKKNLFLGYNHATLSAQRLVGSRGLGQGVGVVTS